MNLLEHIHQGNALAGAYLEVGDPFHICSDLGQLCQVERILEGTGLPHIHQDLNGHGAGHGSVYVERGLAQGRILRQPIHGVVRKMQPGGEGESYRHQHRRGHQDAPRISHCQAAQVVEDLPGQIEMIFGPGTPGG